MKIKKIQASIGKRISIEKRKGLWKAWEIGFGAEADLEEGEDWKEATHALETELKNMASKALPDKISNSTKGGEKHQTSSRNTDFGATATLTDQYQ